VRLPVRQQLTFSAGDSHASPIQSWGRVEVLPTIEGRYGGSFSVLSKRHHQHGSLRKTYKAYFHHREVETLRPSSDPWFSAGMAWRGGYLTLKIGESHSDASGSSLSRILEESPDQKYSISTEHRELIVKRAADKGQTLPAPLIAWLDTKSKQK